VALPEGYHPVASSPGFRVYYLWGMAGEHGRVLQPNDDTKLKWISNIAPMIKGI
jgi:5-deoxy-glucuronate isomerase